MLQGLVNLLPESGAMSFADFISAAQAAKQPAGLWLRAKHQGLLYTWLDSEGNHWVSRNPQPVEGEA